MKQIPTNRWCDSHLSLTEQENRVYTVSKEVWLEYFNRAKFLKNISVNSIQNNLNISDIVAESLFRHLKLLRNERRILANETNQNRKLERKNELKLLLRHHSSITKISKLMNISRTHVYRLKNEIEKENSLNKEINAINSIRNRLDIFLETKRLIKKIGYKNVPKYFWGSYNKINSITKKLCNPNSFLNFFNYNTNLILEKLHFYRTDDKRYSLQGAIYEITRDLLSPLDYDLSAPDFYEKAAYYLKVLAKLQDDLTICEFLEKEINN